MSLLALTEPLTVADLKQTQKKQQMSQRLGKFIIDHLNDISQTYCLMTKCNT